MSRVKPLDPPFAADEQAMFDQIMPAGVAPLLLFRVLARSKRAWSKFLAGSLLDAGPLPVREREMVIDRTCALTGCEYEWGVHVKLFAARASLSNKELEALSSEQPQAAHWSDAERAVIGVVDALHFRATLTDDEFKELRRYYDDDQVLEILLLCGFYRTVAYLANGLALPLEPGTPRFPGAATDET